MKQTEEDADTIRLDLNNPVAQAASNPIWI